MRTPPILSSQSSFFPPSDEDELNDWLNHINEILRSANEKVSNLRVKEKNARIASELSNLVVYCQVWRVREERREGETHSRLFPSILLGSEMDPSMKCARSLRVSSRRFLRRYLLSLVPRE